jgi:hypothetical protein
MIIALTGYKQSGKSVASKYLQEKYNFTPHNFKDGLIKELKQNFPDLLQSIIETQENEDSSNVDLGNKPEIKSWTLERLFEEKPPLIRTLMKNYGTEVRRREDQRYWIRKWINTRPIGNVVIDDLRFIGEDGAIKLYDGIIIRIKKVGQVNTDTHQTESEIDSIPADYTIEAIQGDHAKIHNDLDKIIQTLKI